MGATKSWEEKVAKERSESVTRPGPIQPNLPPRNRRTETLDLETPLSEQYESTEDMSLIILD